MDADFRADPTEVRDDRATGMALMAMTTSNSTIAKAHLGSCALGGIVSVPVMFIIKQPGEIKASACNQRCHHHND